MIVNCLILISLFVLLPVSAPAQNATTPTEQRDIQKLTRSLDELIQLIKEQQQSRADRAGELQKLEIAISYLNFRSRSIEAKEKELQNMRMSRDRMEELLAHIKAQAEQRERDGELRSLDQPRQPSFKQQPLQPAELQQRIDKIESQISLLEVEIMNRSKDLADLENYVEKNLKLIP